MDCLTAVDLNATWLFTHRSTLNLVWFKLWPWSSYQLPSLMQQVDPLMAVVTTLWSGNCVGLFHRRGFDPCLRSGSQRHFGGVLSPNMCLLCAPLWRFCTLSSFPRAPLDPSLSASQFPRPTRPISASDPALPSWYLVHTRTYLALTKPNRSLMDPANLNKNLSLVALKLKIHFLINLLNAQPFSYLWP